jgi:dienelactone hydrolase
MVIVALATGLARAEDWQAKIESLRPKDVTTRGTAVLDNLEQRARKALAAIPRFHTAADADTRRAELRRELEKSLGFRRLPWPPMLNPRVVGVLRRHGYKIEKVVYESLPGALVPAHLYLPEDAERPAPAVLFYPGHWWVDSKSRLDFQAFGINMARLGFVVLNFDPFGQGERGVSSRDHRRTEALLVGIAQQGFAEYETRCALEYLLSRPEVDPRRVGMTGASGGGFNTWITAALDDRIAAAVPVVGTSDFAEQIHVCRPLDWYHAAEHCHFVPGLIRYANNHELLAMAAPKPVLIVAASSDESFPVSGVREVARYGKELYASYGASERIGLVVDEAEGHGYQRAKREAAYGWFLRWLQNRGDGRPHPEPRTETIPFDSVELRCFAAGRNSPAGPAMIEAAKALARDLARSTPRPDLRAILGSMPSALPIKADLHAARAQRLLVPSETDLDVATFVLKPEREARGVLVALDDSGKETLAADTVIAKALAGGWAVCGVDPRGIGESATDKMGWVYAVSLLLGENFVGRQAWDLGRVFETLNAVEGFRGRPFGLYARGQNACLAAMYAIARSSDPGPGAPRLRWYILRDGYLSWGALIDRPRSLSLSYRLTREDRDRISAFDREIPAVFFAFDGLRSFDLPQLLAVSPARGLIVNAIDEDGGRLPEKLAARLIKPPVQALLADEPGRGVGEFLDTVLVGRDAGDPGDSTR